MGLIDFILNVAALLLWLNWLSVRTGPVAQPYSLAGTLKKAGTSLAHRWKFLVALIVLLVFRALFYWKIGSAFSWTPKIHLVLVELPFQSVERIPRQMLFFSLFSFFQTLAVFYLSLLLLSIVNRDLSDADPLHRLVRLHLGWCEKLPQFVKIFLPLILGGLAWWASHPALIWIQSVSPSKTATQVYLQAWLVGASTYLAWRFIIVTFLLLYLINSYVHLGNHPVWNYINVTSRKFLAPLLRLPLRYGRVDFAPLVEIAVVFFIMEIASHLHQVHWCGKILTRIFG